MAEAQQEDSVRKRTDIELIAVSAQAGGAVIDAWVKNTGVIDIVAIEKSDLFLIQPGLRFDELTYNNDGVTSKTWMADLKESGSTWNRSDTLHITITLSGADVLPNQKDFLLRMFTPNGKSDERVFASYGATTPTPPP